MEIKEILRDLRTRKGYSQEELAGKAGKPVLGYPVSGGVSGNPPGMLSPVSGLGGSLPHPSDSVDEVPVGLLSAGQGGHYPEQAAAGRAPGVH